MMVYQELTIIAVLAIMISLHYLRKYRALYRAVICILNNVPSGVIVATHRPYIVICNRLVIDALGLGVVKDGEPQMFDVRNDSVLMSICADLFEATLPLEPEQKSFEIVGKDGQYRRWDRHISSYRVRRNDLPVILLADRTELERLSVRLEQSSTHDPLTGLANRELFHDRFGQALEAAARNGTITAVLAIEIDGFAAIHEEYGADLAKRAVLEIATRLESTTRAADTVARVGQASFAVVLTGLKASGSAVQAADRFLKAALTSAAGSQTLPALSVSIGLAIAPRDGATSVRLLDKATEACRRAQIAGGAIAMAYDAGLDDSRFTHDAILLADLRSGLEQGQFCVEYQPIVELATHRIVHCEALLRWRHPARGLVSPAEFISAAEHSGMIHQLGDFVLRTACRDAESWPAGTSVSVNASVIELLSGEWPLHLIELLAQSGLVTDRLSIEITETGSISSLTKLANVTRQLRRLNVRVMLDDFGTGHSSLSQLRNLEFDGIKIDRQFVYDLHDPRCAEIVGMLVDYCIPRGIMVVAEGVESASQAARLRAMGCTHAQGYFFGRSMAQAEMLRTLDSGRQKKAGISLSAVH